MTVWRDKVHLLDVRVLGLLQEHMVGFFTSCCDFLQVLEVDRDLTHAFVIVGVDFSQELATKEHIRGVLIDPGGVLA